MVDKIAEISILFDFYGLLLPEKQRLFLQLYHEENYSLSEIADEFQISRQGVHDGVKKAEKALHEVEGKLGFVNRFLETQELLAQANADIGNLIEENRNNSALVEALTAIRKKIESLGE